MDTPPGGSNTETLIAACTAMLSRRRFSTSRDFALRLPPSHPAAHQILTVAEILSAADRRDWYAVLQLRPSDFAGAGANSLPRQQFKKLALLLDPNTNTFPFSDEALTCLLEAWHVLSDPQRRQLYDREIAGEWPPPPQQHVRGTFWTACPYCWNMYEYEEGYEDCALRCEGCRKVFQGVAVKPPVREETVVVDGKRREYYRCNASVPLRYYEVSEMNGEEEEEEEEDKNFGGENIVYISDDDVVFGEEGAKGADVRNVRCNNGRVELQGNNGNNGKKGMRVKTVAKKVGGNRKRRQGCADNDLGLDLDADDGGELEFTQGDDGDIFVGVRFNK